MASRDDRVEGVLLATAAGDALGAPYEFKPARGPELEVAMVGGGLWERGEWTDDTAMAIAIAEVAASGADLRDQAAQDTIVGRWLEWSHKAKDVGIQTRSVLSSVARVEGPAAASARAAAAALHRDTGRTAGNGSLMRTAPVALAYLDDETAMVTAARAISELTHVDPDAGDACVLWCSAIRHAVLTGALDVRIGLRHLDGPRRALWSSRLDAAESARPADFPNNGWVVAALQAAWSAIATTAVPVDDPAAGSFRADHLGLALDAAVRAGNDTDTVAAIAGGLLGAAYGASAVPVQWRYLLHGWPGSNARGLVRLASAVERKSTGGAGPAYSGFSVDALVQHPRDPQVLIGGIGALRRLPAEVDAVVSLCRVSDSDLPDSTPHVEVRLIDSAHPDENPHLDFVLLDAVRAIEVLRAQGHTVLVHCVEAYSRTPTVATLYGARLSGSGADEALREVLTVLPKANPNPAFREALQRLVKPIQREHTGRSRRQAPGSGTQGGFSWNGVLDPAELTERVVSAGHRLADAAKAGEWSTVLRLLDDPVQPVDVNWWRPGGTAWFTALHQAAWRGAPAKFAAELISRGGLRCLTDSSERTPYEVGLDKSDGTEKYDALLDLLFPPRSPLAPHQIHELDRHLAEVIDGRIRGVLYKGRDPHTVLRYPPVGILHELPDQRLWFPVPGMYGGFAITLQDAELYVESWCRVVGGSGQAHRITVDGAALVDEGFV